MGSSSDHRDVIEMLAEDFLARRRRRETPAISEYVARHPELEEEIRAVLGSLEIMEEAAPGTADFKAASQATLPELPLPMPERLGDYRVLREIGRGAMGVIYEAEQQSLCRRVALKVLNQRYASNDKGLGRFRREAQAAARLHHTNIVPVFEVGHEGETVYYAMQFIQGQSLDKVLTELRRLRAGGDQPVSPDMENSEARRAALSLCSGQFGAQEPVVLDPVVVEVLPETVERPVVVACAGNDDSVAQKGTCASTSTADSLPHVEDLPVVSLPKAHYFRGVARIGEQVASALGYAHDRGTIHRDIKPSNLLIDASGVVWVADFGLAKFEEDGLSSAGEIPGTLRYMSPERFKGQCDMRTDVYALGATLYEMLLLQPAFASSNQLELLDQIPKVHPRQPRVVDPEVPRDLETIVMKAMDKEPAMRYQSAHEMGEDLQRFLQDEPIRARRISVRERLMRWARRNPVVATLIGVVFSLLLILVIGSVLFTHEARKSERETWRLLYISDMHRAVLAWERNDVQGVEEILARYRAGSGHEYLRGWEWYYLWLQWHRNSEMIRGLFSAHASRMVVSPDGNKLAVVNPRGFITLWDLDAKKKVAEFGKQDEDSWVDTTFAAFSATGEQLAYTERDCKSIVFVDCQTYQETGKIYSKDDDLFSAMVYSPTVHVLAVATKGGSVRLFDPATKKQVISCGSSDGPPQPIKALAFSPNGRLLAAGDFEGRILVWDAKSGKLITSKKSHRGCITSLAFSRDSKMMASASRDRKVLVDNVETWASLMELGPFQDEARAVSFSPKEPLLTVGIRDASVRTWDTTTFTERERIRGYGAIYALTFLPDGRLAFHNTRREIALCNLQNWGTERVNVSHGVHVNSVRLVRHDTDLFLGAMSNDERSVVHLWRINKEGLAQRLSIKPGVSIGCFAVSCHGTWVFGDFESDAVVLLDNPLQTESRTTLQSPAKGAVSTAFSKDGCRLAVGYKDGHVVIWQRRLEKPHWTVLKQWRAHMGRVNSLAFHSKDVAILATGSWDGTARVWNVDEGPALNIGWPVDTCFDVAFSPSGDLVAASGYSRGILLWNWPSKLGRTPLVGHSLPADAVQFLPNEKTLVSAGTDRLIKLWDLMSGQERCSLDGETSIFTSLSISPDGIVIAAGARDGTVRLYRRATEKEVAAAGW